MKVLKPAVASMYTGKGTYMSVRPHFSAIPFLQSLSNIIASAGFTPLAPYSWHMTLIYSKEGQLSFDDQVRCMVEGHLVAERKFAVFVKGFTHWAGHNNEGYIVLEMESPELSVVNAWLQSTFNLPTTFPDYKPHISLVYEAYKNGVPAADALVKSLNASLESIGGMRAPMVLTGLTAEDIE